jgi:signal transduction histidine kinase
MIRWPLRIRLTAGFAVVMALVLAGAAITTVASFRAAFDESIDQTQLARLHALTTAPPQGPTTPVTADATTQVLDSAGGTVLASPPALGGRPLLTPAEIAAARLGQLRIDHQGNAGLTGPVRVLAAPAPNGQKVAVVATSLAGRDAAVADLRDELAVALPLVLLAAIIGAYLIAAAALRPVERMRARAAAISIEDPHPRLPIPPANDEIARLAATLNDLLARQHAALARERRFVADASHDLRTPLGLLTTELELALRRPRSPGELTAALRSALDDTGRLSRLAQDLLLLARADEPDQDNAPQPHPTASQVRPLLDSMITRYRPIADGHTMVLDCPPGLAVLAHPDELDRAVSNLVDNAVQHGAAPITLRAWPAPADGANPAVAIEVGDHGTGFHPDFLPRAFDRFTRADTARTGGGGTGLGLAITAALTARNGGQVTATNHPDGGARVILTLPAAPSSITPPR